MKSIFVLPIALAMLGFASPTWADASVTRTLNEAPAVPAGATVKVENLVGHMSVRQGATFKVTATVVGGGDQAQALADGVKLDVSSSGNQIVVHVDYPVDKYTSYRYVAQDGSDKICVLGIICFHGNSSSSLDYQGKRVHVYRGKDDGVPLHVDVAVELPAGVKAKLTNAVGVLEASGLSNDVELDTDGGDMYAQAITGNLKAETDGGDLHVKNLKGRLDAETDGGDLFVDTATGDLHLETDGGDAHVSHAVGSLDASSDGGDLHVTDYTAGAKVTLRTDGGDLQLAGNLAATRNLDVSTDGGDATLNVSGLSMHLDVSADGGDIATHIPGASNVSTSDDHYSADVGTVQGQGRISSDGGDVSITGQSGH